MRLQCSQCEWWDLILTWWGAIWLASLPNQYLGRTSSLFRSGNDEWEKSTEHRTKHHGDLCNSGKVAIRQQQTHTNQALSTEATKCVFSFLGYLDHQNGRFFPPVQLKVFVKVSPESSKGMSHVLYEPLRCFPCFKGLVGACGLSVLCNLMRVYYFTQTCR